MQFHEFLTPESIFLDTNSQSKTAVLFKVSQILSQIYPDLNEDELFDAFWKRESLGSTAIGYGVLIPHIRCEKVKKTCGCLIKLQNPVDFGAEDKQPIDLVLALVVAPGETELHLETLSKIVKQFSIPSFRQACRNSNNKTELYSLLLQGISFIPPVLEAMEV